MAQTFEGLMKENKLQQRTGNQATSVQTDKKLSSCNEPCFQSWIMKNKRSGGKKGKSEKRRASSVRTTQNLGSWKKPDFQGLMMGKRNDSQKSKVCVVQIDKKSSLRNEPDFQS